MNAVQAISEAKRLVMELFGEDAGSPPHLEEIVPDNIEGVWEVTLSFKRANPIASGTLGLNMAPTLSNYFKTIRINRANGELVSIQDAKTMA